MSSTTAQQPPMIREDEHIAEPSSRVLLDLILSVQGGSNWGHSGTVIRTSGVTAACDEVASS
jgi:hypothetical protein